MLQLLATIVLTALILTFTFLVNLLNPPYWLLPLAAFWIGFILAGIAVTAALQDNENK